MKRRLFTMLSALSLVLCLATAALWVRSYWHSDGVTWYQRRGSISADSASGHLNWEWQASSTDMHLESWLQYGTTDPEDREIYWPRMIWFGFGIQSEALANVDGNAVGRVLLVPYWALFVVFGSTPLVWTWDWYRGHPRQRLGLCLICGYNLWASPERCPECGTAVPSRGRENGA